MRDWLSVGNETQTIKQLLSFSITIWENTIQLELIVSQSELKQQEQFNDFSKLGFKSL